MTTLEAIEAWGGGERKGKGAAHLYLVSFLTLAQCSKDSPTLALFAWTSTYFLGPISQHSPQKPKEMVKEKDFWRKLDEGFGREGLVE